MTDQHPLDGRYRVTTTTSYQGPLEKKSDGETEIRDGRTHRFDAANCEWTSTFEIVSETEVKMTSVADPSNADIEFLLTAPDGSPTRNPVTYEATLKLARKDGDKIQMSGQIHYGHDIVFLTMRKISQ
ncbi:MAG: hypothetical protein LRZ85_05085 [Alphaproteobacteria bacterium]|nr:hypothetical protein [Alphaproteobacteria bacterium]MCD8520330.1 hypothetical protein [Alphaproteobacteria bacterium]MCD8571702.1 hypothetical protein [Alphaproteobacteria bacterium]